MLQSVPRSPRLHELKQRLARRIAAEAHGHWGRGGMIGFIRRHRHTVSALLRLGLRSTGLYRRGARNALDVRVRKLRLAFPHLPEALDGFRILLLADLHIDGMEGLAPILCRLVSGIDADLCVFTGDYRYDIEGPCEQIYPGMKKLVRSIHSRHGIYGILGNHDCAPMALKLDQLGIHMLVNQGVPVTGGLWLLGIDEVDDDPWVVEAAAEGVPGEAFKLMLAHTPDRYADAERAGVDLYLCGHTHAGQVRLPGVGALLLNASCPRRYTAGLWRHGGTTGFTSSGAGCSLLPVRFNCPPEITVVELTRLDSTL